MSTVKLFRDFDPSTVEEGSLRNLDNGAKIVFLNHGVDRGPIVLQTASLRTIKGIESSDFGDGPTKHTMELALAPDHAEYIKLAEMDEKIVELAFNSKQKWLKTKTGAPYNSIDMVKDKYTPTLRIPRDKEGNVSDRWPPTFRVTIPTDRATGAFQVEIWDSKHQKIKTEDFIGSSRNAHVSVIARCTGIWVAGNAFGVSWKAQQILVHSAGQTRMGSFAFIGVDNLLDPAKPAPVKNVDEDDDNEFLDDSD